MSKSDKAGKTGSYTYYNSLDEQRAHSVKSLPIRR